MNHKTCSECGFLKTIPWARGMLAHVCTNPNSRWPRRVIGNPGAAALIKIDKEIIPAWCPEKGKNINERDR